MPAAEKIQTRLCFESEFISQYFTVGLSGRDHAKKLLLFLFHQPLVRGHTEGLLEALKKVAFAQIGFPGYIIQRIPHLIIVGNESPEIVVCLQYRAKKKREFLRGVSGYHL